MENKELINKFLSSPDLSQVELLIKDKALLLDIKLAEAKEELVNLEISLENKRSKVLQLKHQLENTVSLILDIAKHNLSIKELEELK